MRVGMEEAVDEDLLQIRFEKLFCDHGAIELEARQRAQGCDLAALDEVHREHPHAGQVPDGFRHDQVLELLQVLAEHDEVFGFLVVVELAIQALAKLG